MMGSKPPYQTPAWPKVLAFCIAVSMIIGFLIGKLGI